LTIFHPSTPADRSRPAPYRIDAVLFDFDGTLTRPGSLDFAVIKKRIGCPENVPVLEFMADIEDEARRRRMAALLDRFEQEGAAASQANAGAEGLVAFARKAGLPVGILTRNSRVSVGRALENFARITPADIDVMITREDPVKIKPSGEGVRLAAAKLNVDPTHLLVVGDFHFDMQAGRRAGALTAFLTNGRPLPADVSCHFVVETLNELEPIIMDGIPLPAGKLPNAFLDVLLNRYRVEDPSVIVGPSVGEDTAAVDIEGHAVLVLKTDPITFATESIGRYAVAVNANDMATAGAESRWMLATLLLPCGFSRSQVSRIFADLHDACNADGIALCGGHTEITDAVCRPVVTGMMAGTLARGDLIRKRQIAPGDRVLMTKGIAVEGTAIIATEFRRLLLEKGMRAAEVDACSRFRSMISILPEARIAWQVGGVSALHDVTEGGIATALAELSQAGGRGIRVRRDTLPVYAQTRRMADMLGIDPLGLIGSGSLLICCRAESATNLVSALMENGIAAADIGEVTADKPGIEAHEDGAPVPWPRFEVDEITRLFD
jgi:hydrogenase expression/formation protein HypE